MKFVAGIAAVLCAAGVLSALASGASKATPSLPTVTVAMDGKSITVGGSLQSGAVDVHTTATGKVSGSPTFVRLDPGVSAAQLFAFLKTPQANDPNNLTGIGTIVTSVEGGPGTNEFQTILPPGDYVAFDSSAERPTQWPSTTFTVAQAAAPAQLPAAAQTQSAIEFGFRGPATLHNGQVLRAVNDGWVVHMIAAFGVKSPAVGRKVIALLKAGEDKQAEKLATHNFIALLGPASHGATQQFVFHGAPGWYVEACFMDTQDGREHTQLGMERLIHVVAD
ncbi:MAG: hypothetical protein JOZ99_10400 [Actinobacteria bacterium]|nr:hypothetical protein [Actinomycetota bacterium]